MVNVVFSNVYIDFNLRANFVKSNFHQIIVVSRSERNE